MTSTAGIRRTPGIRAARSAGTTLRYVALIVGAFVMITPFIYMVSTSFQPQAYILTIPPQFIPNPGTTSNYTQALGTENFALYFLNSLIVAVISTFGSVLLSSMMAYAFARFTFPFKELIFRILLAGLAIPAVMLLIPQYILAKNFGLLDSLGGLIFFYIAGSLSINTFLLRGFIASIPGELDQAMQVDGANPWTRYWRLALPLAKPAIATAVIFTFLNGWDEYPIALTMLSNSDHFTLPLAIADYQGANSTQWGLVFAASLIAIIPVIIVFLVFQRYFVQGLTSGAVKGMTAAEILPTRAQFDGGDSVQLEVRGASGGEIVVWRLGDEVLRVPHVGGSLITLGWLPEGSYGVEYSTGSETIRTALSVTSEANARLRYGFVVDYSPDRDLAGVTDTVRRLHLTGIQFYDWAYRHANLLGGGENYTDALDQPVSLQTVRDLIESIRAVGASALGYAAVYAVGPAEWDRWQHRALRTASGEPYALGDFLFLVDPAAPDWLESFTDQLRRSVGELGFDGFHLDQYGYPKRAVRPDGESVDVASSFVTMIEAVRGALPASRLVFNNVNDFPTWATADAPQDAVYIEVWEPTVTLGALAAVVARAKGVAAGKPVVIAAYQHVYDSAPVAAADLATSFTMATLFSHGATQLLAGEADRILVDPYYVRNHVVESSTADLLKRWYDFLVEHDAVLQDPSIIDVTPSFAAAYNDDCDVAFSAAQVRGDARAGSIWRRITTAGDRLVVHLINLVSQTDELWDAARNLPDAVGGGVLRFRRVGPGTPRIRVADPDGSARLLDVPVTLDGDYASATLPELYVWQVIVIDLEVRS